MIDSGGHVTGNIVCQYCGLDISECACSGDELFDRMIQEIFVDGPSESHTLGLLTPALKATETPETPPRGCY